MAARTLVSGAEWTRVAAMMGVIVGHAPLRLGHLGHFRHHKALQPAGRRAVREAVRPVPIQTAENWWFPRGMANAVAAKASDLAMIDIMKIGGVTGWISTAGQAMAASLPLSSHTFIEASAHTMASSPTASWFEYLELAGPVLTEPLVPNKGKVVPRGPGLGLEWDEKAVYTYAFE